MIVVLRCFLHGWLNIRKRGKHLKEVFWSLSEKVWHAYHRPFGLDWGRFSKMKSEAEVQVRG